MPAKFEIKTGKNDKLHFNLIAANGEVILTSQMYASRAGAVKGIASIQNNCGCPERFERREGKGGKSHFVLKSTNGRVVGTSQVYKTTAAMEKGIKSVAKSGATAKTVEI